MPAGMPGVGPDASEESTTNHVGTDVLICPAGQSPVISFSAEPVELRSTGQMRTPAPTWVIQPTTVAGSAAVARPKA
jgi:hypothetical protein